MFEAVVGGERAMYVGGVVVLLKVWVTFVRVGVWVWVVFVEVWV